MEQAQKPKAKRELVDIESYFAFVDSGLMVSVVRSSFLTLHDIVKYQFKNGHLFQSRLFLQPSALLRRERSRRLQTVMYAIFKMAERLS